MHHDTWGTALEGFAAHMLARGCARSYVSDRVYKLRQLAARHPDGPESVRRADVTLWFASNHHWKQQTRANARSAVGLFFDWMVETGQLTSTPLADRPTRRQSEPLTPLVAEYREWLIGRGYSEGTIRARVIFADATQREWGETWDRTPAELALWMRQWEGWTKSTYHGHAASLYGWLVESGRLEESPLANVMRSARPKPRPNPLTAAERERTLSQASGRLRVFLLLGFYAGLRSHEIAKIHGADVRERGIYVMGKGGQGATVPTHPLVWEAAQELPAAGHWFPSPIRGRDHITSGLVTSHVATHLRSVGILDGSIHRARATYATDLLRAGVNIRVIQTLMRHDTLAATEHYLGVSEDERMDAIMRLAG